MLRTRLPPTLSGLLVPALSLWILAGCDGSSGGVSRGGPESAVPAADSGRGPFDVIELPETGTLGADPLSLAGELFGAREPMEGRYREEVEPLASSAQRQVVLFTQMDLPDDSMRGLRHRLEFLPEDGQWRLTWAGRQVVCRPGRGHEDWGTEPCL
jgi:hypothetical protein